MIKVLTNDEQKQADVNINDISTSSYISPSTEPKIQPLTQAELNVISPKNNNNLIDINQYLPPAINSMGSNVADDLKNSYIATSKIKPVQAANDVKLSNYMDVPVNYFLTDDDIRKKVADAAQQKKDNEISWDDISAQFPTLSSFLSEPQNMATAKDVIPELAEQEKHFKNINNLSPTYIPNTTIGPRNPNEGATIGPDYKYKNTTISSRQPSWLDTIAQMAYSGAAQFNQGMYSLGRLPIEATFGGNNSVVKWLNERSAESQAVINTAEEKSTAMKGVKKLAFTGGSAAVNMIPTIALTALTGGASEAPLIANQSSALLNSIKSMLPFGVVSAGQYAEQAKQEGATVSQQATYGLYGGFIEMATELPFVRDYVAMTGSKEIVKTGIKNIVKEFGKSGIDFLKNTAEEAIQEVITSPLTQAVKKSTYQPDMPVFGENGVISIPQAESDAYGAFAMTTVMHAMGLPFSSRAHQLAKAIIETGKTPNRGELIALNNLTKTESPHAESTVKINEAKTNSEIYKQTGDLVSKSKYLERLPENWRTLAENNLKDGKLETVYIDSEPFITLLQSMTPEGTDSATVVQEVAKELGVSDQLKESVDTGKPLSIPYATWLEKTAKSPIYKKLEGDIKFSEDGITLNQSAAEEERIKTAVEEEQKKVNINNTSYESIYNDVHDQLKAAGRNEKEAKYDAQIFTSRMIAEGARRKINPLELYMGMMKPEIVAGENVNNVNQEGTLNQTENQQNMKQIDRIKNGESIPYYRNTEKAPYMGSQFGQDIEPTGEYMGFNDNPISGSSLPNYEYGNISFKNPLVVEYKSTGHGGWKTDLSEKYNGLTGKKLTEAVKNDGYDGIIAHDLDTGNVREIVNLGGVKSSLGENQGSTFLQESRANINIAPEKSVITLFSNADASSFLHESSHLFLEDTFQFVKSGQADEAYMKDWKTLSDWLGVKEEQDKLTTDQQEQFARGFESYLMEGKAPSEGLRNAFAAFRRWLTRIYKSVAGLNVELSDPVREVMDRMLATEDEIRAQEMQNGYLDDAVKEFDVSPAVWNKLQDLKIKAHEMAIETLMNSQMKELSIEHQNMIQNEREKARVDIEKSVAELPIYKAIEAVKLAFKFEKSIPDLIDRYIKGEELPNGGNIRFGAIAESFDYSSGDEMAKAIQKAPDFKTEVENRLSSYMMENFGDLKDSPEISEAAKNAVHNDAQLEVMALEKTILSNLINKENKKQATKKYNSDLAKVAASSAKKYASSLLSSKSYKEATATVSYFTAERNAAVKEAKAIDKKNYMDASMYAEQKLLNHALAIESIKNKTRVQKMENYLKKVQRKKIELFKAESHFVQVASILSRFGFGRKDYDPAAKQETLSAWVKRMDEITNTVDIPDWIQDESIVKDYKDLTIDQLNDVVNAIKNIQHVANMEKRAFTIANGADLQVIINDLSEAAYQNVSEKERHYEKMEPSKHEKEIKTAAKFGLDLKRITTVLMKMDGYKDFGKWQETFWEPVYKAANFESNLMNQFNDSLEKLWSVYTQKERNEMIEKQNYYDELGTSTSKMRLLVMALNMGNEDNLTKLSNTPPVGVNNQWDGEVLRNLLEKNLNEKDWNFVQDVWDLINKLWPDVTKMHQDLTGFAPKKVEALPFVMNTADGKTVALKGGYFPLKEDTRYSSAAEVREALDSPLYTEDNPGWRAMTKTGHTKKRTNAQYAVALDITLINRHIRDVIHDLSFRPTIIDLKRIMNNKSFEKMAKENLTPEGLSYLKDWVSSVAGGNTMQSQSLGALENVVKFLRQRVSTVVLLFKPSVVIQNLANPLLFENAVEGFGKREALNGIFRRGLMDYVPKAMFNWKAAKDMREMIYEKSAFMRDRANTPDYSLNEMHNKLFGNNSKVKEFGISMMSWSDNLSVIPMWMEAYNKELSISNNEYKAVRYADTLIDRVMGSGRRYDQSGILRSTKELDKSFSMFYSFMNTQYNRFLREKGILKTAHNVPHFLGYVASNLIMFTVISDLLAGKSPDDDEDPIAWWMKEILTTPLQWFPGIREIGGVALDRALKLNSYGYRPNPMIGQIETITKIPGEIRSAVEGKEPIQNFLEAGAKVGAYAGPYPQVFNDWFFNALDYATNGMEPDLEDFYRRRSKSER